MIHLQVDQKEVEEAVVEGVDLHPQSHKSSVQKVRGVDPVDPVEVEEVVHLKKRVRGQVEGVQVRGQEVEVLHHYLS